MQESSSFFDLSAADIKLVLDLCSKHTYHEAAGLLRRPRSDGGLNISTSVSALCRFYTNWHPDTELAVLTQDCEAINVQQQKHRNAFLGAIRAKVEARVLKALDSGKALADMEKEFRMLRIVERIYVDDSNARARDPFHGLSSYQDFIRLCARAPKHDFIPGEDLPPGVEDPTVDLPPFEFEVAKQRSPRLDIKAACQNVYEERLAQFEAAKAEYEAKLRAIAQSQPKPQPPRPATPVAAPTPAAPQPSAPAPAAPASPAARSPQAAAPVSPAAPAAPVSHRDAQKPSEISPFAAFSPSAPAPPESNPPRLLPAPPASGAAEPRPADEREKN